MVLDLTRRVMFGGAMLTLPVYPLWVAVPREIVEEVSPNFKDEQETYSILEEEKRKLGIEEPINLRIYENNELEKL